MGQFDPFIERNAEPPQIVDRIWQVALVSGGVGAAIHRPGVESIARAVFVVFLACLWGIHGARSGRLDAWTEAHPKLNYVVSFLFMGGALFVLLDSLLPSSTSAMIATPGGLILVATSRALRRRRKQRASVHLR